ncbi:hypothetical protein V1264_010146 [Littorina saxatilis]|uniref:Uncharacterized protein n=1 Tax=Littorina saxatilis TaxID=31220 RepID=A0AAN9G0B5_9CAEN
MWFILVCALIPLSLGADSGCTNTGGSCQTDTSACSGHYQSGLCSGAANRRCCVGCSSTQKALACEIFNSANVQAFKAHPSGVHDNAFPYNNLRDMCHGLKASRSSYACNGCHAPGGQVCLSTGLLKYLVDLKNHGKVIINELAGACHTCTSRHYSGLAVDLHNDARSAEYLHKCTAMGGWGQNEGNHIHCQFYDAPHPNGF